MGSVSVHDHRNHDENLIHYADATVGNLYETVGGEKPLIVMAIVIPTIGHAFLHPDGRAYNNTTKYLRPLKATAEWHVYENRRLWK